MKAGIDFGTTFSLIARLQPDGTPILVPDAVFKDRYSTPSSIYLGDGTALTGRQAEVKFETYPDQVQLLSFIKRHFGSGAPVAYDATGSAWYAESLAALLLKKLRNDAELHAGQELSAAVLTVPAHFNDRQRKSAQLAAALAEIPLLGLLDEPVAAAMHYGMEAGPSRNGKIVFVYDFGGGTFDATVLTFDEQGMYVLAKDGHPHLGGREFDDIVQSMIVEQIEMDAGANFRWSSFSHLQLRRAAEEVKMALSETGSFFVRKNIFVGSWRKEMTFNRAQFEKKAYAIIEQTIEICRRCLSEAGLKPSDIHDFLLVGGSSMIPAVRNLLAAGLPIAPEKIHLHQPLNAVAFGAALRAAQLSGASETLHLPPEFRGVTGYHVGFRVVDSNTGEVKLDTILRKNLPLPCKGMRTYFTRSESQQAILLDMVQYLESPDDAVSVGQISIGPIYHSIPNYAVEVSVENSADGRLHIQAFDPQTGREVRHTFQNSDTEAALLLEQKALVATTLIS